MLQTDTLELAILTVLARVGACTLDEFNERFPSYSWNQVFASVDRLSREGGVILQRPSSSGCLLSLAHQRAEACHVISGLHPERTYDTQGSCDPGNILVVGCAIPSDNVECVVRYVIT